METAKNRRPVVLERLHPCGRERARKPRESRPPGCVCRNRRRRRTGTVGSREKRGILFSFPWTAISGDRNSGSLRGVAAPANSRRLGIPRSARNDDGATVHVALSRQAIQLWISRVSGPGRSGGHLEIVETGRDRDWTDRRVH